MSPYQAAIKILSRAYRGGHHIPAKVHDKGLYACVDINSDLATYDGDLLTRLVVLAHDECVRLEIQPSGPGKVKLLFHPRKTRNGRLSQCHPTIEQAIISARKPFETEEP